MRKIKEIYYLDRIERSSDFSTGFVFVCEDGTRIEPMSTDVVADDVKLGVNEILITEEK